MRIPIYPAMTSQEQETVRALGIGAMGCHFSPHPPGVQDIPRWMPPESILIVDDRTLPAKESAGGIVPELRQAAAQLHCKALLLDLEQAPTPLMQELISQLIAAMPCPVIVPEAYGANRSCPVFLSVPLHTPLEQVLQPWKGREIWLDAALASETLTLTRDGCQILPCSHVSPGKGFTEPSLFCRYQVSTEPNQAVFTLWRDAELLQALLEKAQNFGVCGCVGLFQELRPYLKKSSE